MMSDEIEVEVDSQKDSGPCDCCGEPSRTVSGFLHTKEATLAAYFVHWTPGKREHGASYDLIVGPWGEGARRENRYLVSLRYRVTERGPEFMVVDATDRPAASNELVGRALSRTQVVDTPLATSVFALVDAIYLHDPRIAELLA